MSKFRQFGRWISIPEFWAVVIPLVLAVSMGVTTIALAVSHPDPQVERTTDAVR